MATLYSSFNALDSEQTRRQVTLTEDSTIYGDKVTWVVDTDGDDVTLGVFDSSSAGEYMNVKNPLIVVKCAVNASGTNVVVYNSDGTTALHTFSADYSSTPSYAAFRLVADVTGTNSWRLA